MTDVLKQLTSLQVDGIVLPVLSRRVGFQSDQAHHKFQFRSGEIIEPLGTRNMTLEYTIPFREDIAKGPYKDLFIDGLPRFMSAIRRSALEPIEITDPVHGFFLVTLVSFSEQTDNNKRDGTDVTVQFLHAPPPEDDEPSILAALSGVEAGKAEAGKLDEDVGEIFRSMQKEPPAPLINPLAAISGLARQLETRGNQLQASLAGFVADLKEVEESITDLSEPNLQPTIRSLRTLRDGAVSLADRLSPESDALRKYVTTTSTTVGELASFLGTSAADILRLNPPIAKTAPEVKKGVTVWWKASDG